MNWLRSPYLGHGIGVVAILLALFFYFRPFDNPQISYDIQQTLVLEAEHTQVIDPLVLSVNPGSDVYRLELTVWNSGKRDLRPEDLKQTSLELVGGESIYLTSAISNFATVPKPLIEGMRVSNLFERLNVDHSIRLSLLYSAPSQVTPNLNIDAAGFLIRQFDIVDTKENRDYGSSLLLICGLGIVAILVIRFTKRLMRSQNPLFLKTGKVLNLLGIVFSVVFTTSMVILTFVVLIRSLGSFVSVLPEM
jgi:hypothetical protein